MLTDSGMGKCPLSCGAAPRGTASRARLAAGSGAVPAACNSAVRQMAPDELMAWLLGVGSGGVTVPDSPSLLPSPAAGRLSRVPRAGSDGDGMGRTRPRQVPGALGSSWQGAAGQDDTNLSHVPGERVGRG